MSDDKFDAIVVGGGVAGAVAALLLARAGLEVLLIERGSEVGAKNTSGGRIYAHCFDGVFDDLSELPFEREITCERLSFATDKTLSSLEYRSKDLAASFSVLRLKFDRYLSEQAEAAGASIITGIRVDELVLKNGKVCGIKAAGEEMLADVVLIADGANSLLSGQIGLGYKADKNTIAVGAKEIIHIGKERINELFNLNDNEGAAWLIAGAPSGYVMGGGFIYTNQESISLGVVLGAHTKPNMSLPDMLDKFKSHPNIAPIIKGAKSVEYSAHIVAEGGLGAIRGLSADGALVLGDAAGLCVNVGYSVRGMDLAIQSAKCAAKAVIGVKQNGDFSASSLRAYDELLAQSFVMNDLKLYANMPEFLHNERIYKDYPALASEVLKKIFDVSGAKTRLFPEILKSAKKVGYLNLIKDVLKGVKSL